MVDYLDLLKRAKSQLPEDSLEYKRFAIPKPYSRITGMRTILVNFKEICDVLNRDPNLVLKFLSGEMATAATTQGPRATFQGKFNRETFERLMRRYVIGFVMCPVCKRPDTRIVKEKRLLFLKCEACGAKSSLRTS